MRLCRAVIREIDTPPPLPSSFMNSPFEGRISNEKLKIRECTKFDKKKKKKKWCKRYVKLLIYLEHLFFFFCNVLTNTFEIFFLPATPVQRRESTRCIIYEIIVKLKQILSGFLQTETHRYVKHKPAERAFVESRV